MTSVSTTHLTPDSAGRTPTEQRKTMLRQASEELVGQTFFGEMLKMARQARLKGTIGHGGRGEEVFGGQLDQELARLAGSGMRNSLSDAIYDRLVKNV